MTKSEALQATNASHDQIEDLLIGDLEAGSIRGGIDTVPLPERTSYTSKFDSRSTVMIGTWPQPDMPSLAGR
jgi:hypothetical protein